MYSLCTCLLKLGFFGRVGGGIFGIWPVLDAWLSTPSPRSGLNGMGGGPRLDGLGAGITLCKKINKNNYFEYFSIIYTCFITISDNGLGYTKTSSTCILYLKMILLVIFLIKYQ